MALTTAFWTGLLADILLLNAGLRALIFLLVAIVPDLLRKYLLVEGSSQAGSFSWEVGAAGVPGPHRGTDGAGLLPLMRRPDYWRGLGVYVLSNTLFMVPLLGLLDFVRRRFKLLEEGEP
ncbi:hypothetical protein HS125_12150 [bacterium]|nr:hypothetical protein [bacterium]